MSEKKDKIVRVNFNEDDSPLFKKLSEYEEEPINWLWYPYLPKGELVSIDGETGLGKSHLAAYIAACVTSGKPFYKTHRRRIPREVILCDAENSRSKVMKRRVRLLGGDSHKVFVNKKPFVLTDEDAQLEVKKMVNLRKAGLIVIDPLTNFFEGNMNDAIHVTNNRKVFVVHGHDNEAKETVARFLAKLDLDPIILHEKESEGRTVIEKFEHHSDVGYAVVLVTPDDVGAPKRLGRNFSWAIKHHAPDLFRHLGLRTHSSQRHWQPLAKLYEGVL